MAETPPSHPTPLPPPYQCGICGGFGGWHDADCANRKPVDSNWPVYLVIALVVAVTIGLALALL